MSFSKLSDSEYEVMELLWSEGRPLHFREIMDYFDNKTEKGWKKQTVNTFLARMLRKKIVKNVAKGRNKIYVPALSKEEYMTAESQDFVGKRFQGSIAKLLVAFSGGDKLSKEEAEELKRIINDWEDE